MRDLPCMRGHRGLEAFAAIDVIAKHVEARAGGRQQDRRRPAARARSRGRRRLRASGANSTAGVAPESAAASAGASRPSRTTARQCASTAGFSGAKSCPLPSPPAMSTTGRPMPSSAARVAATVVPFESLTNSTSATSRRAPSDAAGRGRRRAPQARLRRSWLRPKQAQGQRAHSRRCAGPPTRDRRSRAATRRRARATASPTRSTRPHSCSPCGTRAPNVCTRAPG